MSKLLKRIKDLRRLLWLAHEKMPISITKNANQNHKHEAPYITPAVGHGETASKNAKCYNLCRS